MVSHFNPLAPRGARRMDNRSFFGMTMISIHSPLAGRDRGRIRRPVPDGDFNPLAPRGARRAAGHDRRAGRIFQSTRPSRGETWIGLPPDEDMDISIHSPLAGRDRPAGGDAEARGNFNPLAPRGARRGLSTVWHRRDDFNPLAPRGARQQTVTKYFLQRLFTLHNSYPCKFGNRDYKQENEVCLGKKQAYIWCEPTRNWV